jgi:hypothetical protein
MIPGEIVALLTFPGVIIHEAAHMLFCKWGRIAVLDVCFFRIGNPAGYVATEEPQRFSVAFLISVGPFIVNSIVCIILCFPAFVPVRIFDRADPVSYFQLWLGLSIGMHAFPSTQDANALLHYAKQSLRNLNPLAILSFPLIVLIYLANIGSIFWLDLMYGVAIGLALPEFFFSHVL